MKHNVYIYLDTQRQQQKKNTQENAIAKTISINLLFKFPTFSNVNKPTPLYNNNVTETTLFGIIIHNTVQYKQF